MTGPMLLLANGECAATGLNMNVSGDSCLAKQAIAIVRSLVSATATLRKNAKWSDGATG